MKDGKEKSEPVLMADAVIMEDDKVLMVKRAIEPFSGYWVLPGGHVDPGETAEEAVLREVKEELSVSVKILKLIGVYSDPKRDPRYPTVSHAFLSKITEGDLRLDFEASEYKFFLLDDLPEKIGFDHLDILGDV